GSAFMFILLAIVLVCVVGLGRSLKLEKLYAGGAGKSAARRTVSRPSAWLIMLTALILLFLYVPMILVVLFSFDRNIAAAFPLQGFTLEWYRTLMQDTIVLDALKNSLIIASLTAILTVAVAAPAAYAVVRFRFPGRELFRTLILIPIIVP